MEVLQYGIGLTAILPGHISTSNDLPPLPTEQERARLRERLLRYAPRFVCYNGRDVFRMCYGGEAPHWGPLPDRLGASQQFVAHSTSGRADRWGADRLYLFREFKSLVDAERG